MVPDCPVPEVQGGILDELLAAQVQRPGGGGLPVVEHLYSHNPAILTVFPLLPELSLCSYQYPPPLPPVSLL